MKNVKEYSKIIIAVIIGMIISSGITVYATYTYLASDIKYTKNSTEMSVETALNDLYSKLVDMDQPDKILNGKQSITVDDNYKYCILFVGRGNANGNTIMLNNESITPLFVEAYDGGNVTVMGKIFKNLKTNDVIEFTSAGYLLCWK